MWSYLAFLLFSNIGTGLSPYDFFVTLREQDKKNRRPVKLKLVQLFVQTQRIPQKYMTQVMKVYMTIYTINTWAINIELGDCFQTIILLHIAKGNSLSPYCTVFLFFSKIISPNVAPTKRPNKSLFSCSRARVSRIWHQILPRQWSRQWYHCGLHQDSTITWKLGFKCYSGLLWSHRPLVWELSLQCLHL